MEYKSEISLVGHAYNDGNSANATPPTRGGSYETDKSFLYGGKCDLKTGKCTKNTEEKSFLSFGWFSTRNSFASKRSRGNDKLFNGDDDDDDDDDDEDDDIEEEEAPPLLARAAYWLNDNKYSFLIGGGVVAALYLLARGVKSGLFSWEKKKACRICDTCRTRAKARPI